MPKKIKTKRKKKVNIGLTLHYITLDGVQRADDGTLVVRRKNILFKNFTSGSDWLKPLFFLTNLSRISNLHAVEKHLTHEICHGKFVRLKGVNGHSRPIRQTFELRRLISAVGKNIRNLVKL